jgi:hypothetical protein
MSQVDPSQRLVNFQLLIGMCDEKQTACEQAFSNRDYQTVIRESTIGIATAQYFTEENPEFMPAVAWGVIRFYGMRATSYYYANDGSNSKALSDIEQAFDLQTQYAPDDPDAIEHTIMMKRLQSIILAE